jgi:hypothetical protein
MRTRQRRWPGCARDWREVWDERDDSLGEGHRRLLACYPRSFLRENADEVLTVLLDTAAEGQTRVGLTARRSPRPSASTSLGAA